MNSIKPRFAVGDKVIAKPIALGSKPVKATVVGFIVKFDEPIQINHGSYWSDSYLYGKTVHTVKEFYDIEIIVQK